MRAITIRMSASVDGLGHGLKGIGTHTFSSTGLKGIGTHTFSSTEFMCRSSVADSCIDCIRIAVEPECITTVVDHNGCRPRSRGPLWSASVDGLGHGLKGIGTVPTQTSTVADPFTTKLLGSFEALKSVCHSKG